VFTDGKLEIMFKHIPHATRPRCSILNILQRFPYSGPTDSPATLRSPLTREIRRIAPSTKKVFLTVHEGPGFKAGTKPWAHGFVSKSEAGKELIPTLERIAGITANERTIECPHCKVRQNIHVAVQRGPAKKERQYISCINCHTEFDVSVPNKIVAGPFVA
jgi:hypothetical protein